MAPFKNPFAKDDRPARPAPGVPDAAASRVPPAPAVPDAAASRLPPAPGPVPPPAQKPALQAVPAPPLTADTKIGDEGLIDLQHRREQLRARVAELTFDLGGLVYEMAIRDRIRVDILARRAAILQNADAELNEVERILRVEETSTAGVCVHCGAPHSSGAAFCWQCGQPLLEQVPAEALGPRP